VNQSPEHPRAYHHDLVTPQDGDLEMKVLGGIMLEATEAYPLAAEILTRDDFYIEGHQIIFDMMGVLYKRGIMPDTNMIIAELKGRSLNQGVPDPFHKDASLMDKCGGQGVIMGMINSVPTAANVVDHATKLKAISQMRQIMTGCTIIRARTQLGSLEAVTLIEDLRNLATEVESGSAMTVEVESAGELVASAIDNTKERIAAGQLVQEGYTTGFKEIDRMSGGLVDEECWVWAGATGTGKSRLGVSAAVKIAEQVPVGYINLEMGRQKFSEYVSSSISSISGDRFTPDDLFWRGGGDWVEAAWDTAGRHAKRARIHFIQKISGINIGELNLYFRRLREEGCRVIFLDQAQRTGEYRSGLMNENRGRMGMIFQAAKDAAGLLGITVITLHQVNRQGYDIPTLADLSQTSMAEHVSDHVMFFYDRQASLIGSRHAQGFVARDGGLFAPRQDDWGTPGLVQTEVTNPRPIKLFLAKTRGKRKGIVSINFDYRYGMEVPGEE
jgi:replicative DNA helicase